MNRSSETAGPPPVSDRQTCEMIARCVATMVFFRSSHKSPKARAVLRDEASQVAGWARAAHLSVEEIERSLLDPVRRELIDRYGSAVGNRLAVAFRAAFDGTSEAGPAMP